MILFTEEYKILTSVRIVLSVLLYADVNVQDSLIRGFGDAAGRCVSVAFQVDSVLTS